LSGGARLQAETQSKQRLLSSVCALVLMAGTAMPLSAVAGASFESEGGQTLSVGAGFRGQFQSVEGDSEFTLPDIRIYTSGSLHENVKFTFNLQQRDGDTADVLDAIAQFEFS